jgi:hypothetical protein
LEQIMRNVLGLLVVVTLLGATQAGSEEVRLEVGIVGPMTASRSGKPERLFCYRMEHSGGQGRRIGTPIDVAIIERNREDRERNVVIDR